MPLLSSFRLSTTIFLRSEIGSNRCNNLSLQNWDNVLLLFIALIECFCCFFATFSQPWFDINWRNFFCAVAKVVNLSYHAQERRGAEERWRKKSSSLNSLNVSVQKRQKSKRQFFSFASVSVLRNRRKTKTHSVTSRLQHVCRSVGRRCRGSVYEGGRERESASLPKTALF